MTLRQMLDLAGASSRAGQFLEAERLYREVLAIQSDHAEALQMLGMLAYRAGRTDEAAKLLRRVASANPEAAEIHANLGILLAQLGNWDEAIVALGCAVKLQPRAPQLHYNLGKALRGAGRLTDSITAYENAVDLRPDFSEAHNNLGSARAAAGQIEEAVVAYRRAIALKPDFAEAYNNLGAALQKRGQPDQAIDAYQGALALRPEYQDAVAGLCSALIAGGDLDGAITACERALARRPDFRTLCRNLGWAYKDAGRVDEAIACYRTTLAVEPNAKIHSDLLFTLHFHPAYDRLRLLDEHRKWNEIYAASLKRFGGTHNNDLDPNRRLRVGYVAHDLGGHSIGRFLLPLLANHDPIAIETFGYCDHLRQDPLGQRLRAARVRWHETASMSDEQVAQLVRQDQIDILVDLTMHLNGNRLLMFGRKPAPVQVTYLAYCTTTGLETMDYRLTDAFLDPPQWDDSCYSEQSVRLPHCYWCYVRPSEAPEVGPLPALSHGTITFGSLGEFGKISPDCLAIWCELLRAVPRSRLLLHARKGRHRMLYAQRLVDYGIDPARLEFIDRLPLDVYLGQYRQIDVALDPFPYGGGATTLDALWMGVPVVSLAGETGVSRGGLSILSNLGLPELVANNARQYVCIARGLANDLPRLAELRSKMRQRMLDSPLTDATTFAHDVENAYRWMWRQYCSAEVG